MKKLTDFLTEARQVEYRVALSDVRDAEDLPISITMLVDKADQKNFEKWLEDQQDNLFMYADGGNVEY